MKEKDQAELLLKKTTMAVKLALFLFFGASALPTALVLEESSSCKPYFSNGPSKTSATISARTSAANRASHCQHSQLFIQ